ncbi:MAG: rhomboid family intramembrane serine protease [Deltaproteobacteria bacterium]|nr:rhomboid family intramembrane serine protease [Deltaproteobacteria bacterium]
MHIAPPTAEMTALLHQLALSQGGRYLTRLDEAGWSQQPAMVGMPPSSEGPHGPKLPAGSLLILPWDHADPDALTIWLQRLFGSGSHPDFVAVVTSVGHVHPGWLTRLGDSVGARIAAVEVATGRVVGDADLVPALQSLFDEETAQAIATVNPLEKMQGVVADPRDPRIFAERLRRAAPRVWVGTALLAANVLVFALMQIADGWPLFSRFSYEAVVRFGANTRGLTLGQGEVWRLLACTFVHGDLLHIAMNMWALRVLGDAAERLFGAAAFSAVYFVAGLGGSLASLAFTLRAHDDMPSVGASGAIFGLMGALLGYALSRRGSVPPQLYRSLTRNAAFFIVVNGAIGLSLDFIDNGAHMGGLAFGLVAGLLLSRDLPPSPQPTLLHRAVAGVVCGALLAFGWWFAAR